MRTRMYVVCSAGMLPGLALAGLPFVQAPSPDQPAYVDTPHSNQAHPVPSSPYLRPHRGANGVVAYSDQLPTAKLEELQRIDKENTWGPACAAKAGKNLGSVYLADISQPGDATCELRCAVSLKATLLPHVYVRTATGELCDR